MRRSLVACAVAMAVAGPAHADIIQKNAASRTETGFLASTSDLINAGATSLSSSTHAGYVPFAFAGSGPTSAANLNDGSAGLPYIGVGHAALSTVSYDADGAWTSTYRLDTTSQARGYDISAIRTMSGWSGIARNQRFEVLFATVNAPETFTSYGTYSYMPGGFGAARVTLTDSTGTIAKEVAAVRFSIQQAGGNPTVFREFDLFGAPTGSGLRGAFQQVSPDDSRIAYSDYARLVKLDASAAVFDRPVTGGQGDLQRASPAARVRFRTDATMITASFTTGTLGVTLGTGVMLVDGRRVGTFDAGVSGSAIEVDVPVAGAGYRDIELLMPNAQDIRFTGLTVNGEAGFQSPTMRPQIRYVAYGDSITQGFWSSDSSASYPSLVGERNGWEVVNMGFGWRGMKDSGAQGLDGTVVGTLDADVVSVMMGYNDASTRLPASSYRAFMEAFVARVRDVAGTVPIYVITPLYTSDVGNQSLLQQYRDQIIGLVHGSQDPNLHWIDGLSLGIDATNVDRYTSDGIHPNDAGFSLVASNLAPRMDPTLRSRRLGTATAGLALEADLSRQMQVVPEPAGIAMAVAAATVMLLRMRRGRRTDSRRLPQALERMQPTWSDVLADQSGQAKGVGERSRSSGPPRPTRQYEVARSVDFCRPRAGAPRTLDVL